MESSILIVGSGPTGLALALVLRRNNVPVRIIEKRSEYPIGSRGCGVQPRILELYKILGILPEFLEVCTPLMKVAQFSPRGNEPDKILEMATVLEPTPARPYNNPVSLGQDRHEALLRSMLEKTGCKVELETEFLSFEQHADHVVARLAKTLDGQRTEETAKFAYLVGADGARSQVRKQLGLTFLGESVESVSMVIGDLYLRGLDKEYWRMWGVGTGRLVALRPMETNSDRFNFFFQASPEENERIVNNPELIFQGIKEMTGRTDIEFGELICAGIWRPNIRMVNNFGEGRVFVAGDAAHVHSPTGGQGMNSGVQDAFNLGWKLSLAYRGIASEGLLESYSRERLPVIATMLDKTTELFQKTFRSTGSEGWVRGYELRQFGVNYRGSPIVVDQRSTTHEEESPDPYRSGEDGKVRAGDRAPDAPGLLDESQNLTSLLDIFKPICQTVIVFTGDSSREEQDAILQTVAKHQGSVVQTIIVYPQSVKALSPVPDVDRVLVDRDGHAYKNYAVSEKEMSVVIVRPDGFIGAVVFNADGLRTYMTNVFV
ncbi:hypothetical protein VKT23_007507 [Stygiomarasmius scandens]|uniref:FAD-binding domain-containing protein n=1 Tax=Marasmiellus scandens TaxID=2682957 RepID=A0ABR1JKV5_9AGAR